VKVKEDLAYPGFLVARRQAQVTERSLAEQNERARLNFEMEMMLRLEDRIYARFPQKRRRAANYVKEHFFTDHGELLQIEHVDRNTV